MHAPWQRHLFQVYIVGVLFAYFSAFWLRSGKRCNETWRIRLVQSEWCTLTLRQAALRFFLALSGLLLGSRLWWALVDRDQQFLHDPHRRHRWCACRRKA